MRGISLHLQRTSKQRVYRDKLEPGHDWCLKLSTLSAFLYKLFLYKYLKGERSWLQWLQKFPQSPNPSPYQSLLSVRLTFCLDISAVEIQIPTEYFPQFSFELDPRMPDRRVVGELQR